MKNKTYIIIATISIVLYITLFGFSLYLIHIKDATIVSGVNICLCSVFVTLLILNLKKI